MYYFSQKPTICVRMSTIMFLQYRRTEKGQEELKNRSKRLNARQRALLLIIEQVGTQSKSISQPWEPLATPENIDRLIALQFIEPLEKKISKKELKSRIEIKSVPVVEAASIVLQENAAVTPEPAAVEAQSLFIEEASVTTSEEPLNAVAESPAFAGEQVESEQLASSSEEQIAVEGVTELSEETPAVEFEDDFVVEEVLIEAESESLVVNGEDSIAEPEESLNAAVVELQVPAEEQAESEQLASEEQIAIESEAELSEETPALEVEDDFVVEEVLIEAESESLVATAEDSIAEPEELLEAVTESLSVAEVQEELFVTNEHKIQSVSDDGETVVALNDKNSAVQIEEESHIVADEILINGKKPLYDSIPILTWQVKDD
jgi:hypothetical protein